MHEVHCTAAFASSSFLDLDDGTHEAGLESSSEHGPELSIVPEFELGDLAGHMICERLDAQHAECVHKREMCDAIASEDFVEVNTDLYACLDALESNPGASAAVSEHVCMVDAEFLKDDHLLTVKTPVNEDVVSVRGRLEGERFRGRRGNGARARSRVRLRQKESTTACDCATGSIADACMVEHENSSNVTVSPFVYEEPVIVSDVSAENFLEKMIIRVQSVWRGCSTRRGCRSSAPVLHRSACCDL